MKADFHLLRQSALGVCGAALLGFSLGGCASTHKPRFWDQQDVKNSPDAASSPSAATAANDPAATAKPAPTVVVADHATSKDASGHVDALDFADSTPSAAGSHAAVVPGTPPAALSDSFDDPKTVAPAPAPKKSDAMTGAQNPFVDPGSPAPVAPAPSAQALTSSASGKDASADAIVTSPSSSTGSRKADPFADADNPVFVGQGQGQPAAPPAPPQSTAVQDPAPSPPPASAQSSDLFETPAPASTPSAPKSKMTVSEKGRDAADPFAESQSLTAPKAPAAPAAVVAESPNCAAPAPSMPSASAESLPETPAAKQASVPAAKVPSRAPVSAEQAADFDPVTIPQASKGVAPISKSVVAAKPETAFGHAKPAVQETSAFESKELEWTSASGNARPAKVSDAMILDSGSVRGKFTGVEHSKAKTSRTAEAPIQENPSQPAPQAVASPKASVAPSSQPAPQQASPSESANFEGDEPFGPASQNVPAVGHTAHEPAHKPLSGVVNAVAQQVSPSTAADPFALEQAVETSPAAPSKSREPHTLASVNVAQELDPFGQPSLLESHEAPSAESTAIAPSQARQRSWLGAEIAFVVGLAVGLSAGLLVWLRSRLRKAEVPVA